MIRPTISIVTVCFNAKDTIENTICSVLRQDYRNLEYVLIDGGSTDGTLDVLKRYSDRFSFMLSEPDKGIYDAMNKGLEHATGEWVLFMNSGDTFRTNTTLSRCFAETINPVVKVLYGDMVRVYEDGERYIKADPLKRFESYMPFSHQSALIRTDIAKQMRFDLQYKICADYAMFYRMFINEGENTFKYLPFAISTCDTLDSLSFRSLYRMAIENHAIASEKKTFRWWIVAIKLKVKQLLGFLGVSKYKL